MWIDFFVSDFVKSGTPLQFLEQHLQGFFTCTRKTFSYSKYVRLILFIFRQVAFKEYQHLVGYILRVRHASIKVRIFCLIRASIFILSVAFMLFCFLIVRIRVVGESTPTQSPCYPSATFHAVNLCQ